MRKTFRIATLGCKVNQQESEALAARFCAHGLAAAANGVPADIYLINSCTVTAAADAKTRQQVRRARTESPEAFICLMGCLVEAAQDTFQGMPEVDLAIGSHEKERADELVLAALAVRGEASYAGEEISTPVCFAPIETGGASRPDGARTRAFLKAEDGCDRFCAYCIIPYARGSVRSRKLAELAAEARALLAAGYKELVLTGINLALWGQDFKQDLFELLRALCALQEPARGEYRIRLGSLEPTVIDAKGAVRLASLRGVCPQLHLSLQSGSARTLSAMGRPYTPFAYEELVHALREIDPLFAVTTDVIVGFPGETDADFEESLEFVSRIGFSRIHVFKYSKRPGTRAAKMAGQLSAEVKNARSRAMLAVSAESEARFLAANAGGTRRTLLYGPDEHGRFVRGLTDNGLDIKVPLCAGENDVPNTFANIEVPS